MGQIVNLISKELDGMIAEYKSYQAKYGDTPRAQQAQWRLNKIQQLVEYNRDMMKDLQDCKQQIQHWFGEDMEVIDELLPAQLEAVQKLVATTDKWVTELERDDRDDFKPQIK